jgi:Heterokaryon incompatibility protein (HET)
VLRQTSGDRVLWIDALAINQSDIPERNVQVPKMPVIYSTAFTTLVWLGTAGDLEISYGLRVAMELSKYERFACKAAIERLPRNKLNPLIAGLGRVVELEYWKRVWVAQEIMYSHNASLITGDCAIPYSDFAEVVLIAQDSLGKLVRPKPKTRDEVFLRYYATYLLKDLGPHSLPKLGSAHLGEYLNLSQLRVMTNHKSATDPRDKVFGFHGCLHPDVRRLIEVDYSQDLRQVHIQITKALLKEAIMLDDILTGNPSGSATLEPSWIWTPHQDNSEGKQIRHTTLHETQAAGRLPLFYDLIDHDTVLHVKGKTILIVEVIAPSMHLTIPGTIHELLRDEVDMVMNHLLLLLQFFNVPLSGPWFRAFNAAFHPAFSPLYRRVRRWLRVRQLPLFSRRLSDWLFKAFYNRHIALHTALAHADSRMFTCKAGSAITYGRGPLDIIPGDKICVIQGCSVPLVFRQVEDHHTLIGQAYVWPLMFGWFVGGIEAGDEEAEDFFLR